MKYNNGIMDALQVLLTEEEVKLLSEAKGYRDTSTKLSVYSLLQYLIAASIEQTTSMRKTVMYANKYNLTQVDYSSLSKKMSNVPYEIYKELFHILLKKCNRKVKRALKLEKGIVAVDSTTITTSKTQLKWAGFHGQRAGVKLHVQFDIDRGMPTKVEESIAKNHDFPEGKKLDDSSTITVRDRAYTKIEQFDEYENGDEKQLFVIRIKDNLTLVQSRPLKRIIPEDSNVVKDVTCKLGKGKKLSRNRFRIVTFTDERGKEISVCTNIKNITSEDVAEIYKARWTIESFFRMIKQNLNISTIFGTTEKSVYNQLYAALICYVLLKFIHTEISKSLTYAKLTFGEFIFKLRLNELCPEVRGSLFALFDRIAFWRKLCLQ